MGPAMNSLNNRSPKVVPQTIQDDLFSTDDRISGDKFEPQGDRWGTTFSPTCPPENRLVTSRNASRGTSGDKFSPTLRITRACVSESFQGSENLSPAPTLKDLKALAGHATGRSIHATRCATCRQPILTGLDNDQLAIQARVDWTPLDEQGELQALLAGRHTYRLERQTGGNPKLTRRAAKHIRARRKHWQRYDIVPAHRCESPPLPAISTRLTTTINLDPNQPCPF